jgi:hypothetical protein
VYCPECGKLFKGESKMLMHIEKDHVSKKKHSKELTIELVARYLGGHTSFPYQRDGILSLYAYPVNKVVFESDDFNFEIPTSSITGTRVVVGKEIDSMKVLLGVVITPLAFATQGLRKENKVFYIEFKDEAKTKQTVVFDHSDSIDEFVDKLAELVKENKVTNTKSIPKPEQPIVHKAEDPLHIIKIRYAKGEITKEQYEDMKRTLTF